MNDFEDLAETPIRDGAPPWLVVAVTAGAIIAAVVIFAAGMWMGMRG